MAIVKLANPITNITGNIGNTNFKRDKYCIHANPYMYKKRRQPTSSQKTVREAFQYCKRIFRSKYMSDGFRDEWITYAANNPTKNRIGEAITITGLQYFMKINIPRRINSLPILLQPVDLSYI